MSLKIIKEDGLIRVMVTSDPENFCSPLCQIIWNMCLKSQRSYDKLSDLVQDQYQQLLGLLQMVTGLMWMFLPLAKAYSTPNMIFIGHMVLVPGMINISAVEYPARYLFYVSQAMNLVVTLSGLAVIRLLTYEPISIYLIVLSHFAILSSFLTAVFALLVYCNTNRNKENEDEEPLLKEDLISSAEKKLHHIPVL